MIVNTSSTVNAAASSVWFVWGPPDDPPPAPVPARPVRRPDGPPVLVARQAGDGEWTVPAALCS